MRGKALAVQKRAAAAVRGELALQERREHDANQRLAVLQQRHGDSDARKPSREVGRAVERIDGPHRGRAHASAFFGEDGDAGGLARQNFEDRRLGTPVSRRHVVAASLHLGGHAGMGKTRVDDHGGTRACSAQRDRQE